ncbi:MAG TPA: hypothetical protein VIY73_17410, partial [Polyangiaceae bacterium]
PASPPPVTLPLAPRPLPVPARGRRRVLRRRTMIASSSRRHLLVLAVLLLPRAAFADPPATTGSPTEEQIEAARVPYHDARELHRQGRTREALEKALEAHRIAPTPVTALEVGQILVEVGRLVDARDVLRSVAFMPVSPRESDKGREARAQAAVLAGQLDMRIPKIAFADRPAAVEVTLDAKPVVATDPTAWLGVDPGAHALQVRVEGRVCTTVNLSLSEGEERTIDLHDAATACRPEAPAPVQAPRAIAPAPPSAPLPQPVPPLLPPTSRAGAWRVTSAVLAGAGVVGLGVGAYLALGAKSDYDGVASECSARGCDAHGFEVRNAARTRADVATVVLGVGAAAIVGGAIVWLAQPSADTHVGLSLGGVAFARSF